MGNQAADPHFIFLVPIYMVLPAMHITFITTCLDAKMVSSGNMITWQLVSFGQNLNIVTSNK